MEKFCKPNLPEGRVKRAFVSAILPPQIVSELNDFGIRTYKLGKTKNILSELAFHPDILINNYTKGRWVVEKEAIYLPEELPGYNMIEETYEELGDLYPYDCLFNCFRINDTVFCGMHASYTITFNCKFENIELCYVPQGYSKCSTILVSEKACITCDPVIAKELRLRGIDVLKIPDNEGVNLNGFPSGLIGGCAALISKDILAFTGNLNTYKYGADIIDFCKNAGVDAFSLTNADMYDYGGILPISEIETE